MTEFDMWLGDVNAAMRDQYGLDIADLPDYDYWMAFEAGDKPYDVVHDVVRESGMY